MLSDTHHVIVVGGGAAGLSVASELGRMHIDNASGKKLKITILEANSSVGGRVRTIRTNLSHEASSTKYLSLDPSRQEYWRKRYEQFSPWSIPLGAEFVHGNENNPTLAHRIRRGKEKMQRTKETTSMTMLHAQDWEMDLIVDYLKKTPNLTVFVEDQCFDWYDGTAKHNHRSNSSWHTYINKAKQLWDDLLTIKCEETDMNLEQFVEHKCAELALSKDPQQAILSILNAVYAVTAASTQEILGVKETSRQENSWPYGEKNFRLGGCYSELIEDMLTELESINDSSDVIVDVVTDSQVLEISSESEGKPVHVKCSNNMKYVGDYTVVTVPLAILTKEHIRFTGACTMTKEKQHAIKSINMLSGGKVHALIKLDTNWKIFEMIDFDCLRGIFVCPLDEFKQIWFRWDQDSILVTGFCVYDGRTDQKKAPTHVEESLKSLAIRIISKTIPTDILHECAKLSFSAFDIYDWSDDEYVQGMYSSPSVSSRWTEAMNPYRHLAEPMMNVYFAGEHTHTVTSATVQSALESGVRAAHEIYEDTFRNVK